MINWKRTNSEDDDFKKLVALLDADLLIRDGDDFAFYSQFNKLDQIKHVVVAYQSGKAIACGAIKQYELGVMEIKRMFVIPERRGKQIASEILLELEKWAVELSFEKCILETGTNQPEAIGLYQKNGYSLISNYGQYEGVEESVCFEKTLK